MNTINRTLLVLKPRQPFLDWANSFRDGGPALTPESTQQDCTAFLISEISLGEELDTFVATNATRLFEYEPDSWMRIPERWPAVRDVVTFRVWFDVEVHTMVIDLAGGPITKEPV